MTRESHKILVVDDNEATRQALSSTLARCGHTVLDAADGKTALELMESHQPPLVLLDLMLPDTDGFNLIGELRARAGANDTTIIALSGYLSKLHEARLSAVGFDDVIGKPVEAGWVTSLVEERLPRSLPERQRFGLGKSVLVVDDDPLQLRLIRFRLCELGFEVHAAADGEEALALIPQVRPDLVVADVLMPKLDGFELAAAVRQERGWSDLPVVLVTSSYVEAADRELALRAGAHDLVVRTPELDELTTVLRAALNQPVSSKPPLAPTELEQQRARRLVKQLERHVQLNSGLTQRCSALAAELSVLTRVSEAVLKHSDLDAALEQGLAGCFDAGGVSAGALYVGTSVPEMRVQALGVTKQVAELELGSFFGHPELLQRSVALGKPLRVPSPEVSEAATKQILARAGTSSVLVMPLMHLKTPLGALAMFVDDTADGEREDLGRFVQAIANQISQVLAMASAFTERQRAEQLAIERTAFLDALLEQAPDSVIYVDAEGVIRYASKGAENSLLRARVGASIYEGTSREHVEQRRAYLAGVIATGTSVSWEESYAASENSVFYWFKMGPVRRGGSITGAVIVARDNTDKKRADAQLLTADRMASVGMLAAGVAHEINNPLAAVVANLHLSVQQLKAIRRVTSVPQELIDGMLDACDAAERIRVIVRDLKMFSRDDAEQPEAVEVRRVIESTLRLAWAEVRTRARIVKDFAAVPPVAANKARLGQVILNLVINAAHAIPPGDPDNHTIRIITRVGADGRVVIGVADNGAGIPPVVQSRLFTPFFTTKPVGVGTGLGLSICQRIVKSFGGEITFQSEFGKGTEFQVYLPAAAIDELDRPSSLSSFPPPMRTPRVLCIDDEEKLGQVIKRTLEPGCEVTAVTAAAPALELLRRGQRFDVILCDVVMPEINGFAFYLTLREFSPMQAERVLFLTGGTEQLATPSEELLPNRAQRCIDKPFSVDALRALVSNMAKNNSLAPKEER